jgi:hypothetical protein
MSAAGHAGIPLDMDAAIAELVSGEVIRLGACAPVEVVDDDDNVAAGDSCRTVARAKYPNATTQIVAAANALQWVALQREAV